MAVYAELFDGTRLEFPDGTDPSVISATAKRVTQSLISAQKPETSGAVPDESVGAQPSRRPEDFSAIERNIAAGKRGVESLGDITGGLGLAGTAITGTDAETAAKMMEIKREQAKPQEIPGLTAGDIERIYKQKGLGAAAAQVPSYITEQVLQSAPQMAGPLAAGAGATALAAPLGPAAPVVGALVGIGTYGIQQFGNFLTRQAIEKNDPRELSLTKAAMTAGATAPLGYFADRFTAGLGGLGTKKAGEEIIKELSARQVAAKVGKRAAVGASAGVIAEAPLEVLEQAAERWQAGLELTGDDAANEYKEAFFGAAAAGAGIGGASRAIQAYQTPVRPGAPPEIEPPALTPPEEVPPEAPPMAAPPSESQDTQAMIDEFRGTTPPPVPPVPPAPPVEPPIPPSPPGDNIIGYYVDPATGAVDGVKLGGPQNRIINARTGEPIDEKGQGSLVLGSKPPESKGGNIWEGIQNRDRSTPASIAQMTKIANEPDYSRVSMSRDYGTGAPIVAGNRLEPAQLGRVDTVTGSDGKKSEIQYAVVDSRDVIASHNADGTKNPDYINPSVKAFRAVTNGRVAGLQAAYNQGTATDYKNALLSDDLHGIDKKVIEGIENPMLVRVMPMSEINKNTGDISNTGAGLTFNIVEQAKNDTNRLDLSTVSFTDAGDVSQQTIKDFIKAMPTTEQGNLIDKQGNPTKQAVERVDAAIFQQAYGNDKLTELAFQAQDEEARNIVRALNMAASKAIRLTDAGDYDVRPLVNEAVEIAINARRNNTSLSDAAKQADMTTNPMANQIVQMFADNPRSAKAIGENLSNLFDNAYNEGSKEGADMFGEVPKRPVDQLIKDSFAKKVEPDLFAQPTETPTKKPIEKPVDQPIQAVSPEPKEFKIKKSMEEIAAEIGKMTKGSQVSQWLFDNAPNSAARSIAEKINTNIDAIEKSGVPISIQVLNGSKRFSYYGYASYIAKNYAISNFNVTYNGLNSQGKAETYPPSKKPTGTRYSTIMHEMLHVLSMVQLGTLIKRNFKGPEKVIYNELRAIYRAVEQKVEEENKLPYEKRHPAVSRSQLWLKDLDELWVRSLTESDLQDFLSTINMGKKTALTKIMEIFRKVVGINPEYQSALDKIMTVSDKIFAQTPQDINRLAQHRGYTFVTRKRESGEDDKKEEPNLKTNTPQFKKWFGKSKVVNKDGSPKVVYHGTDRPDFDIFDPASWFSDSPLESSAYAQTDLLKKRQNALTKFKLSDDTSMAGKTVPYAGILSDHDNPQVGKYYGTDDGVYKYLGKGKWEALSKVDVDYDAVKDPYTENITLKKVDSSAAVERVNNYIKDYGTGTEGERGRVYPVYLSIKNPLRLSALEANRFSERTGMSKQDIQDQVNKWKTQGYDGIITTSDEATMSIDARDELGGIPEQYIPFDSNQIKSAISNTGEYSTTDARIQKEEVSGDPIVQDGLERQDLYDKFSPELKKLLDKAITAEQNAKGILVGRFEGKSEQALKSQAGRTENAYERAFDKEFPKSNVTAASVKTFVTREGRFADFDNRVDSLSKKEEVLKEEPTLKTDTPQFNKWFGSSKITNEDGSPKVLYHATAKDISVLKPGGFDVKMSGPAIWMSDRSDIQPAAHNIGSSTQEFRAGTNVMPLYARIENPLVLDDDTMLDWARQSFANGSKEFPELITQAYADAIKEEGYDGIIYATTDINKKPYNEIIAFESNQLKSSIGNTGEYSTEVADIRYEEAGKDGQDTKEARNYLGQPVAASWAFPEDRFIKVPGAPEQSIDKLLYIFQDKQIDLKRAQEGIAKAAGEITDNINAYDKEQLFHGKVATGIRNFLLNELMPAIKKIKESNLTTKDMQDYLLARHAEERNNRMNELNKLDPRTGKERETPWELQDRASGMSTADARKYLADLEPAKKQSLETIGKMFDKMVTGTQNILVESGSESQATIDAWNEAYEHYMPLFRVEEDFNNGGNRSGLNKGFNVNNPFSKRAMGSAKEVQNIVTNLIKQRERALIRAEKLTVTKALYGLFLMNPNPDIALPVNPDAIKSKDALIAELQGLGYENAAEIANNLMQEPKSRYISKDRVIDKDTGLPTSDTEESVKLRIDSLARFGDNVLTLRVDGKNRYIFFNQDNPNAVRIATSLKSLDTESLGSVMSIVAKGTRWFANVNTQYNPIFAAVNLIRDIGSAQFNLTTTPLAGKQAQVTAGIFPAMRGIFKILRAERSGEVGGNSEMEKAFREFREEGGQTGYRDALARKESEKSIVDDMLKKTTLSGNALKAMKSVFGALSDFNDTLENSIRLSAYIQASKPKSEGGLGLSKQQAAVIAKNLTVNFDKKGQISANVNALYAFFNASVQGTARLATTLTGPKGKAIIGGGILLGTMQSVLLAAAGFRDDEPPEFVKQRNFVIPTPDGNYLTIPYPLGFNLLPNIGRITTEFMISGGKNPAKRAGDLMGSVADAFSPIGSSGLSMQTIAPTVLDPLAALEANKDAFGRPIYKEDRATNPTPGYLRSRENASEMNKAIAYFFNLASGGTKYSKGFLSPTADELDYVVGQVTGGLGREIMKTGQTIKAAGTGEDLPAYRVPLLGRFYGETESNAAESQRFYNNITRMADHENEIKGRIKNKESVASYYKDNPEARLYQQANTIENQINALNKQKKEFIEKGLPKDRIKRIENQKASIMKRFNDQLARFED